MVNNKISQVAIASILSAFMSIASAKTIGQTIEIDVDGKAGHAVVTDDGTITAMHVGGIDYDYSSQELDIAIDTKSTSRSGFKTSDFAPDHFIDRRGRKHRLHVIGNFDHQTLVSLRFFPGESGMPIFANDGSVTCIVLGNVLIRGRWYGRVARVSPIVEFSKRQGMLLRRN